MGTDSLYRYWLNVQYVERYGFGEVEATSCKVPADKATDGGMREGTALYNCFQWTMSALSGKELWLSFPNGNSLF